MSSDNGARNGRQEAAVARLVRQSGQCRHDRALSRALPQLRHHARRAAVGQADHRHRPDRFRPLARATATTSSWPSASATASARPAASRIEFPVHPIQETGKRPTAGARPQPRLSQPRRSALRLPARRRGADHRLRQDHARHADGRGDGQHPGDRAVGRPDAERLVQGRAHRLGHHRVEGPRDAGHGRDRLRAASSSWSRPRRPRPATATPWARPRR